MVSSQLSSADFGQLLATLNQFSIGRVLALGQVQNKWFVRLLPLKNGVPNTGSSAYKEGQGLVAYFPSNTTLQNSFFVWPIESVNYAPTALTTSHSALVVVEADRAEALVGDATLHFHNNTSNYFITHEGWLSGTCWSVVTNDWNTSTGVGTPLPSDGNITISVYINGIEKYSETLQGPLAPTPALIDPFTGLYDAPTFDGGRLLKRGEVPILTGDSLAIFISGNGFPGFGGAKLVIMMDHIL